MRWLVAFLLLFSFVVYASPSMWTSGTPAIGTAVTLEKNQPIDIVLPEEFADKVKRRTMILYFAPTCPHCQAVMPEINQLAEDLSDVDFIAIASSQSSEEMLKAFKDAYAVKMPIIHDKDSRFAQSLGARATPNLSIFEPKPSLEETETPKPNVILLDAYLPYSRGYAGILRLRNQPLGEHFTNFKGYQGNQVCINCHQQEGRSWVMTHHAQAYYTIYQQEKTDEEKCVSCHVTGLGEKGGFEMGDHSSPLVGVGCESCHSASGPHDGEAVSAVDSCVQCHDAEHSINFSVDKGLPHIDHFIGNTLSDEEWGKRIEEIAEGTAPKPLLQFSDGQTVGAAKCRTCHEAVHPKDLHRKAVKTLPRKKRTNGECLTCHATAKEIGVQVQDPEYHVKDGVGCESCHGAGGEHVKSPSKENIIGLGDSCPVCVVEAVCTSCHTPKWDPKWDLETRLQTLKGE